MRTTTTCDTCETLLRERREIMRDYVRLGVRIRRAEDQGSYVRWDLRGDRAAVLRTLRFTMSDIRQHMAVCATQREWLAEHTHRGSDV